MTGMKISLDAAMRARDVSSGWRDDPAPDHDEPDRIAAAGRTGLGAGQGGRDASGRDASGRDASAQGDVAVGAVGAEPRLSEPTGIPSQPEESVSPAVKADRGEQRRRANGPRRRRRTRLRRGRPA